MESTATKPQLSSEEIARLEEIVDDQFILKNVSVRDLSDAIKDYAYQRRQA